MAAAVIRAFDIPWLDPVDDAEIVMRLAEFAVVVALFSTGLKLDRELSWRSWGSVVRLLGVVMPLTIAAIAVFGVGVMGLPLAAAVVLGAALAPTDPVLAGDIGVGPPGEEDEREPHFAVTAEAGLNDGLAFPFVALGLFLALEDRGGNWVAEWLLADVLYAVPVGLALGAAPAATRSPRSCCGSATAGSSATSSTAGSPWAPCSCSTASPSWRARYGFLAAFAGGIGFRRYERDHEVNERVHQGAEVVEKFSELAAILLLGSMVTIAGWAEAGWAGAALVPILLLAVRPAAVSSPSPALACRCGSAPSSAGSGCAGSARSTTWPSRSWPARSPSRTRRRSSGRWRPASSPRSSLTA